MITVRMHAILAERSRSGKRSLEVTHRPGLTVEDVVIDEGLSREEADLLMVVINNKHSSLESSLQDGDAVDLMLPIAGGDGRPHHTCDATCGSSASRGRTRAHRTTIR